MNLRQKQYDEILDEENKAKTKVMDLLYKKVNNMKKDDQPKNNNKQIGDKLFSFYVMDLSEIYRNDISYYEEDQNFEKIGIDLDKYNRIMNIYNAPDWSNSERAKMRNMMVSNLQPILNSFVEALNENVEREEFQNETDYYRLFSYYTNFKTLLDNIKNGKFKNITQEDLIITFNQELNRLSTSKKRNVIEGLVSLPASLNLMRGVDNTLLKNEIKRLENQYGRKLNKQEVMNIAIRIGGFDTFVPYFDENPPSEDDDEPQDLSYTISTTNKKDINQAIQNSVGNDGNDEEEEEEPQQNDDQDDEEWDQWINAPPAQPTQPAQSTQQNPNFVNYDDDDDAEMYYLFGQGKRKIYNRIKKNKAPYKYNDDNNNIYKIFDFE
jgi:hypothetical protein